MTTNPLNALEIATLGLGHLFPEQSHQSLQARIDLFEESIILTKYEKGKPITTYEIDSLDLATSFSGQAITTGHLPPNILSYTQTGGWENITIVIPSHQREITEYNQGFVTMLLPLPTLIFNGHGHKYSVWAIKSTWPNTNEPLYHVPLTNVSDTGAICTGNVPFPVSSKQTIHQAAELFFDSTFNNHYSEGKSKQFYNIIQLWREIAGDVEYPIYDLEPSKIKLTDIISGLLHD